MELSEFERLAKHFAELPTTGNIEDIIKIQNVMRSAGRAFFNSITKKKVHLGNVPSWLKKEPKKNKIKSNDRYTTVWCWDLYWWCGVAWLIKNKFDSGIYYSPLIKKIRYNKNLLGYSLKKYLIKKKQLPKEKYSIVCYDLIKASETTCLYLASLTTSEKKKIRVSPGQTTDSRPINKRFTFRPGQVLFNGKELNIRGEITLEIMKTLVKKFDNVIPFQELDENSKNIEASEKIRAAICRINKKLKSSNIPMVVENRYGVGYKMCSLTR